ncbi:MAG TPA: hypothetical protein VIU11_22480 [Nakamurella sp.]
MTTRLRAGPRPARASAVSNAVMQIAVASWSVRTTGPPPVDHTRVGSAHELHVAAAPPVIICPGPRLDGFLSMPGLLMAILRCSAREVGIEVYYSCVLTLMASTPPDRLLPEPDSDLAQNLAAAALAVLQGRRHGPTTVPQPSPGT